MPDVDAVRAFLEPRHLALAEEAGAFSRRSIATLEPARDDPGARKEARKILGLLGESGWCRQAVPAEYGGAEHGPDFRACCLVRESLASISPLADSVFALQCLGSLPITLAGDEEQKLRFLPGIARGETMTAFAMTEPGAGSDVAAMTTRARSEGDGYVLDGGKHLITNAGVADLYTVFAVTSPGEGTRGLSCFVVEAGRPGFRFVRPQILSEPHPLGEIAFDGCRVPASCRLGVENEGFKLGMRTLDRLRATVAAAACGMAEGALREALAHARQRRQFGRPLADFQLTQQKLAGMATELTAARMLVYRAAAAADSGADRVTLEAAMAKAFATEAAQRVVDGAVQILGGRGVLAESLVDRLYRSVRALRIYEGATEIQHLVIARQLLHGSA